MVGFRVVALNDVGTKALQGALQEEKQELSKRSYLDRLKFKKIWIRKTTQDPLTDEWTVNPDAIRFLRMDKSFSIEAVAENVEQAMLLNGAQKGTDYSLEVEND